ncbi:MAG: recombinase family protein [Agitococcus sp.]|uniref:recombinase family protein n=1 Tax=uncultured Agitococcus sp. TaxID=1506599 RepID=UPI002630323D|nr:recombinase family protein [uncultured Agitococcus sp.]HRH90443.1 recombinase family protein [Agitococcus sp.]
MEHLSIGETGKLLGVSVSTPRRWEVEKTLLPAYRTVGGHRRYLWQDIQHFCGQFAPELRKAIAYARVSSHDQKDGLERQAQRLEQYCTEHSFEKIEILQDLGSGLNYHKKQKSG